jgi:hypothetical protein
MRLKQAHMPSQQLEAKKMHGSANEFRKSALCGTPHKADLRNFSFRSVAL